MDTPTSQPSEDDVVREHLTKIAESLGIALLDTFRGPVETQEDRIVIISKWKDLANSICDLGELR